jgi:hypothetical protein
MSHASDATNVALELIKLVPSFDFVACIYDRILIK